MAIILILMGVSGSGKTTVGQRLSQLSHWDFFDADDFHSPANVTKMQQGQPLTDGDRDQWLSSLSEFIRQRLRAEQPTILACSALKRAYRDRLHQSHPSVHVVYLCGSYELIHQRLQQRQNHFMTAKLLESQFDTLEEPDHALIVNIDQPLDAIVHFIFTHAIAQLDC